LLASPPDLIERLADIAARRSGHTAVEAADATLTYAELDGLSNQLARRLIALGLERDACVGISLPRGAGELLSMLAALKAGGAYLPLDPAHPRDRLQLIVEDARPQVMVVRPDSPFAARPGGAQLLIIDDLKQAGVGYEATPPPVSYDPEQLAYVLFTSGSTGRPKGVEIPRRAFANLLRSLAHTPGMTEEDRLLAVSTTTFDIAGLELFLPLWVGATVVIADRETVLDPRRLSESIDHNAVTVLQGTPTTWRLWMNGGWRGNPRLRLFCGGEALSLELARRLGTCGRQLWNMYGPTETTIYSSIELVAPDTDIITIGKPIDETQFYLLDEALRSVPRGALGEIYIGGSGLARGYRGQAELTAERFVQNPQGPPGDRLYRTGDLGRQLDDGRFECRGRLDDQVKLRGFRIELGEIESILRQAPGVTDAAVVARATDGGQMSLVGYYVVSTTAPEPTVKVLRKFLQSKLPDYMVPSSLVALEKLPVNTNQKIDRQALSQFSPEALARPRSIDPPRNDHERKLVEIWRSLLDSPAIGIKDDFFDLGGTSLQTVSLIVEIEKAFGRSIPLSVILTEPTIEKLAVALGPDVGSRPAVVLLREGSSGAPVFFIHAGDGEILVYRKLALRLREDHPVYGIQPLNRNDAPILHTRLGEMIDYYFDEILKHQTEGPYFLGGLCTGGLIALEVARKLQNAGHTVGMVALIDTAYFNEPMKSLAQKRLQSFSTSFTADAPEQDPLARVLGILRKASRKIARVTAYETRRQTKAAGDAIKVKLLRYFVDRDRALPRFVRDVPAYLVLAQAEKEYVVPERYGGELLLFRATATNLQVHAVVDDRPYVERYADPLLGWEKNVAAVKVHDVPGGHVSMLMEPSVRTLADRIQAHIDAALEVARQSIAGSARRERPPRSNEPGDDSLGGSIVRALPS